MKNKNEETKVKEGIIPMLARKVGERSVDAACTWWLNQPKVPESMRKQK